MASTKQTLTWVKNSRGTPALVRTFPEGASETFKKGALLHYDESENGVVEVARTAGVPDAATLLGIALEDATGTSGTDIDVLIPGVDDVFVVAVASDADTPEAPTIDMIGDLVGIVKLSTTGGAGTEYVANSAATTFAKVIGFYGPDQEKRGGINATFSAGDRVLIQFISSVVSSDGSVA